MQPVFLAVRHLVRRDDGQDLLEYGLLVVLIAIVAMGAVATVGSNIHDFFWVKIGAASF
jgi:Flp pilus assembly pilin Flp